MLRPAVCDLVLKGRCSWKREVAQNKRGQDTQHSRPRSPGKKAANSSLPCLVCPGGPCARNREARHVGTGPFGEGSAGDP